MTQNISFPKMSKLQWKKTVQPHKDVIVIKAMRGTCTALHLQHLIKKQRLKPGLSPCSERTASCPPVQQELGFASVIIHCFQQTVSWGRLKSPFPIMTTLSWRQKKIAELSSNSVFLRGCQLVSDQSSRVLGKG